MTQPSATPATLLAPMADDDRPYTTYRARPAFLKGRDDGSLDPRADGGAPEYEVHGRRRRLTSWLPGRNRARGAGTGRITPRRVLKWLAVAVVFWLGIS